MGMKSHHILKSHPHSKGGDYTKLHLYSGGMEILGAILKFCLLESSNPISPFIASCSKENGRGLGVGSQGQVLALPLTH